MRVSFKLLIEIQIALLAGMWVGITLAEWLNGGKK